MRRTIQTSLACLAILVVIGSQANAGLISSAEYSLTEITGDYLWGHTDTPDPAIIYVDNVIDRPVVDAMMSDGYIPSAPGGPHNGIYGNLFPGSVNSLTFEFNGGTDYLLDSLSFLTSRAFQGGPDIAIEIALDGAWANINGLPGGSLIGIPPGDVATVTFGLGGLQADAFRIVTTGGNQLSLHEVSVDGSLFIVEPPQEPVDAPEPASLALCGIGMLGLVLGVARRRRK